MKQSRTFDLDARLRDIKHSALEERMHDVNVSSLDVPEGFPSRAEWIYVGPHGAMQHVDLEIPRWTVLKCMHFHGHWELAHCTYSPKAVLYVNIQRGGVILLDTHKPHSLFQARRFSPRGFWIGITSVFKTKRAAEKCFEKLSGRSLTPTV